MQIYRQTQSLFFPNSMPDFDWNQRRRFEPQGVGAGPGAGTVVEVVAKVEVEVEVKVEVKVVTSSLII